MWLVGRWLVVLGLATLVCGLLNCHPGAGRLMLERRCQASAWTIGRPLVAGRGSALRMDLGAPTTPAPSLEEPKQPASAFVRRVRYRGKNPVKFEEKYKELSLDPATVAKVLAKGGTPAGMHVPILLDECLLHLGLLEDQREGLPPQLVVDCTLGYGGHSSAILGKLISFGDKSKLLCLDQDPIESNKAEIRLRQLLGSNAPQNSLRVANVNFRSLKQYLADNGLLGKVTALLCDLGLSSMQIDDPSRGFSFKAEGPLDMRMDPVRNNMTAANLLETSTPQQLSRMLLEHSDEAFHEPLSKALLVQPLPTTTTALRERVRECLARDCGSGAKDEVNNVVRRVMQALRIEVNQEFCALDELLADLPEILAPRGARAVFLTFHSGEDRRVKKAFKQGVKDGLYASWSRDVVRASAEERRNNSRSACCKLRWCTR